MDINTKIMLKRVRNTMFNNVNCVILKQSQGFFFSKINASFSLVAWGQKFFLIVSRRKIFSSREISPFPGKEICLVYLSSFSLNVFSISSVFMRTHATVITAVKIYGPFIFLLFFLRKRRGFSIYDYLLFFPLDFE